MLVSDMPRGPGKTPQKKLSGWLWLLSSLAAVAITWVYTHRVLVPWEYQVNIKGGRVIAQLGDLYPRWVGTRELLLHGKNPYGPEVSHEIQMGFYGHTIVQTYGEPGHAPIDEQRFAYPVFVVLLLAPTVHVPFHYVQRWGEIVLVLLVVGSAFLWLRFLRWRLPDLTTAAIILLVLASPQIVQGLRFRQLGLLVAFLITASAWCVRSGYLGSAGMLLALSTIKPQMVVLVVLWFLLWAGSEWRQRWQFLAGFAGMLALLAVVGEVLLPGWIGYFLAGLAAYRQYFPTMSWLQAALGLGLGNVVAGVVILLLLVFGWKRRREDADSPAFVVVLAAFFLVTTVVIPLMPPFNQILLLLPTMLLLRDWHKLSRWTQRVFVFFVAWPWVAELGGLAFSAYLRAPSRLALLPSFATILFPFALTVLVVAWHKRGATEVAAGPA